MTCSLIRQMSKLCAGGGLALILLGATACSVVSPIERRHGYMAEKDAFETIEVGKDTKATLTKRLGSPSTRGTFDPNVWYYISHRDKRFAFLNANTVERDVVEVRFDGNDRVVALQRYDVKDGHRIAYVDRETPTRGKEISFWEQMFGNVGRGLPGGAGQPKPTPGQR